MADDIRLYMFDGGTLKCHVENIKMNQGLGDPFEIPVPWYLLTHPKGNVVIDGGNAAECATTRRATGRDRRGLLPRDDARSRPSCRRCKAAGFDPADVKFIVQSHLHLDHTGALAAIDEFPNAQVVVTRKEYEYAQAPDWFAAGGYIKADFMKPGVAWLFLEEHDDGYDLFDDGMVRIWQSPGHAPGPPVLRDHAARSRARCC